MLPIQQRSISRLDRSLLRVEGKLVLRIESMWKVLSSEIVDVSRFDCMYYINYTTSASILLQIGVIPPLCAWRQRCSTLARTIETEVSQNVAFVEPVDTTVVQDWRHQDSITAAYLQQSDIVDRICECWVCDNFFNVWRLHSWVVSTEFINSCDDLHFVLSNTRHSETKAIYFFFPLAYLFQPVC